MGHGTDFYVAYPKGRGLVSPGPLWCCCACWLLAVGCWPGVVAELLLLLLLLLSVDAAVAAVAAATAFGGASGCAAGNGISVSGAGAIRWCLWPWCSQWSFFFWRWAYKVVRLSVHICYWCWWRCWCWDWCGAGGGRAAHLRPRKSRPAGLPEANKWMKQNKKNRKASALICLHS